VEAPEPAQQDVIRAPGPDAAPPEERPDDRCVVEPFERRELKLAGRRRVREFEDRLGFALAEADRPQRGSRQAEDACRCRESVQIAGRRSGSRGEPVEERQSRRERELLAGDGVEQALKDGREAGRLNASVPLGELVECAVAGGARVEAGEVQFEPEEPREC
jgi:hypothetical protein